MRRRIDLSARVDVDEGVAAVGVEIRQRQYVVLHVCAAEHLLGLERQLGCQVVLGKLEVAGHVDLANLEDRAFVDVHRDADLVAMAGDYGVADMDLQVAVIVVKSGQAIGVLLQLGTVERAGVEEAAEQIMLARFHQPAQLAR